MFRLIRITTKGEYYLRRFRRQPVCIYICPHVRSISSALTGQISVKLYIVGSYEYLTRENSNLVKIWQQYRALHMKTKVPFAVAGDIKSP